MTDVFSIAQGNGVYNPPCALEQPEPSPCSSYRSPKSIASPCVAINMRSITLVLPLPPPILRPRIESDADCALPFSSVRSPKLIASPKVAIVKKSIMLEWSGVRPPIATARVLLEAPAGMRLPTVKSVNLSAFAVVEIVMNSISLTSLGACPPKNKPRVGEDAEPQKLTAFVKLP